MITLLLALTPAFSALQTQTPPPVPAPVPSKIDRGRIAWIDQGLDAALVQAKTQNKLVMVDFRADWCAWCTKMTKESFSEDKVLAALENVLCVSVDTDKYKDIATRYRIKDLPAILWFNSDGTVRERVNGYQDTKVFLANTARIKADIGTYNDARRKVAVNGKDLDARFELYRRLKEIGDQKGVDEQKAAIQALDPQGNSRGAHHIHYDQITSEIESYWAQNSALPMPKIGELQGFIEVESDPDLLYDGWMRLANTHEYLGNQALSKNEHGEAEQHRITRRQFVAKAYRSIPPDPALVHDWSTLYAGVFWDQRNELSNDDKQFMLTLTGKLVETNDGEAIAHDFYARALFLNGQQAAALEQVTKAIELDPSNALYKDRLKELGSQ
jgi:thiol-disulfide isomerase/thioredoxin